MSLLDDMRSMLAKVDKIPKMPRRIEMTKYLYLVIQNISDINELLYGKPNYIYPFCGVEVRVATCKEQEKWTEEERKRQFKVVY